MGNALGLFQSVLATIWRLVHPIHGAYRQFIWLLVLYEGMGILLSYTASSLLIFHDLPEIRWPQWLALFAFWIFFEELYLRVDNRLDWAVVMKLELACYRFIRETILSKCFELDPAWHEDQSSGQLIGKINSGIEKLKNIISITCWDLTPTCLQTLLSLLPLLYFSPWVALLTSISFSAFAFLTLQAYALRQPLKQERYDLNEVAYEQFQEFAGCHRTVIQLGQQGRLLSEHCAILDRTMELSAEEIEIGVYRYNRYRFRIMSYTKYLAYAIWAHQLQLRAIDVPTFFFLNVVLEKLLKSFWRFNHLFERVAEESEGAKRIQDVLGVAPELMDGPRHEPPSGPITIECRDVSFAYPTKDEGGRIDRSGGKLININLIIPAGQMIALVGRSGSGKSTLQNLISRLRDPDEGAILLNGIDAREWRLDIFRSLFAHVSQGSQSDIFNTTVWKNICYGRPDATPEEVERAAKMAGFDKVIPRLPQGYQTIVGEHGVKLSGGEGQRLIFARAILMKRPILVLDEATSAVDAETERGMLDGIHQVAQDKTVIVIAHRLSTVMNADRIVVLDEGRIIEQGSHEELMRQGGAYAAQVEHQTAAWTTSPV